MDKVKKAKWVEALRSGEYEQGHEALNVNGKFCCLGVLCDLAVKDGLDVSVETMRHGTSANLMVKYDSATYYLPAKVAKWAGIVDDRSDTSRFRGNPVVIHDGGNSLASLNDNGYTFDTIADVIEEQM